MGEPIADLQARIVQLVAERGVRPGERVGSERELAETLGVSRTALRAALERMERAGSVRRLMGRSGGVFASDGKIERQLNTTAGVPAMLRQQGIRSTTTVLRVDLTLASAAERRALALAAGTSVVRITRRRDADGVPWSLDTSVLPSALVPGITGRDLSTSLYALMQDEYGLEIGEADETIDVIEAPAAIAETLGLAPGNSLLQVWRTTRTPDGTSIEFAHDYFRADRTRVHLRRHGARWKRVLEQR